MEIFFLFIFPTFFFSFLYPKDFKMGMLLGKTMEDNFQKNQDFMQENQRVMMERQIQMQNEMRERMMAQSIARSREMFNWFASFYLIASLAMIRG